jgi:GNAT superfamily N-acetyltransferase
VTRLHVRFCRPDERDAVRAFFSQSAFKGTVSDFAFCWDRWKNWDRYPPIVAVSTDGSIVGAWAATFSTRTRYANTYFVGVLPALTGQGVASRMFDFFLTHAAVSGCSRVKLACKQGGTAELFWRRLGFVPFGEDASKQLRFDQDIIGAPDLTHWRGWIKNREKHAPMDLAVRLRYKIHGVVFG